MDEAEVDERLPRKEQGHDGCQALFGDLMEHVCPRGLVTEIIHF